MITIIHGDDVVSSRKFLSEQKKSKNSVIFDQKNLNFSSLLISTKNTSIFPDNPTVVIENFLSSKNSDSEKVIDFLNKNAKNYDFILWEENPATKTNLNKFRDAYVKEFKITQSLFLFLDNIKPKNNKNVIYFHKTLETTTTEIVFYMLIRQFRILLALQDGLNTSIDEIKRLAPWQREKFQRQLNLFSFDELKKIYNKLYDIDLKIKVGEITNLIAAIDFLLLDI